VIIVFSFAVNAVDVGVLGTVASGEGREAGRYMGDEEVPCEDEKAVCWCHRMSLPAPLNPSIIGCRTSVVTAVVSEVNGTCRTPLLRGRGAAPSQCG
jgi:hypothetical protein